MMLIPTRVAASSIHGLGLFTTERLLPGTPIWRFEPGFDQVFNTEEFWNLPILARKHTRWYCFVRKPDLGVVLSGDHACFINHASNPNTGLPESPDLNGTATTLALRMIEEGEELTCNYLAYDADTPWKLGWIPREDSAVLGAGWEHAPKSLK